MQTANEWIRSNSRIPRVDQIEREASKFPKNFGLRAFPDKLFSISLTHSYVSEGRVYLYVFVKNANGWESFCKGTSAELSYQIVEIEGA
jgi:hypothetical protein